MGFGYVDSQKREKEALEKKMAGDVKDPPSARASTEKKSFGMSKSASGGAAVKKAADEKTRVQQEQIARDKQLKTQAERALAEKQRIDRAAAEQQRQIQMTHDLQQQQMQRQHEEQARQQMRAHEEQLHHQRMMEEQNHNCNNHNSSHSDSGKDHH